MADNEGARKTGKAYVVCTTPDVCLTAGSPVPYSIVSYLDTASMEATTVRMTGMCALTMDSYLTTVTGDEPGTGGGLASGVNRGYCVPISYSSTVKAAGNNVLYHSSEFWMNCPSPDGTGNTKGRLYYLQIENYATFDEAGNVSSEEKPSSEPETPKEKSWWESTKEWLASAAIRTGGLLNVIQGTGEGAIAAGLALAPEPTMLTKAGAVVVGLHASDTFVTGAKQFWTGEVQKTVTSQAISGGAQALGADRETADQIGDYGDMGIGIAIGVGGVKALGKKALLEVEKDGVKVTSDWWKAKGFGDLWPGVNVPKYFKLEVAGKEYFVNTNATKHMAEFMEREEVFGHSFPLSSMASAVEEALQKGLKPGRNFLTIGNWELGIDSTDNVIYHAIYRP